MSETALQRCLRLVNENGYYGTFSRSVCPYCGMSCMIKRACGSYCCNCGRYVDIDEVIE